MARQRFIHPDFWTDPSIGRLTPTERLFFVGCFSNADDEGRLLGEPAFLRSTIFPYDDMSIAEIREIRDRVVVACPNLRLYEVDGVHYLAFTKWRQYQQPRYPKASKLPPPPDTEAQTPQQPCGEIDASLQPSNGTPAAKQSPQIGFGLRLGLDRVGGDQQDETPESFPEDLTASERICLSVLKDIPNWPYDYTKDLAQLRELVVDFPRLDLAAEVKRLRDYLKDKPLTPKGNPRLRLRNWCEKASEWLAERSPQRAPISEPEDPFAKTKAWLEACYGTSEFPVEEVPQ